MKSETIFHLFSEIVFQHLGIAKITVYRFIPIHRYRNGGGHSLDDHNRVLPFLPFKDYPRYLNLIEPIPVSKFAFYEAS